MRYDMKYKKLNVEDNESCNLQCEKKCEKLAGVFICCILAFFLLFLSTRNVGLIYCYADELSEDSENTAEDAEQEQQEINPPEQPLQAAMQRQVTRQVSGDGLVLQ